MTETEIIFSGFDVVYVDSKLQSNLRLIVGPPLLKTWVYHRGLFGKEDAVLEQQTYYLKNNRLTGLRNFSWIRQRSLLVPQFYETPGLESTKVDVKKFFIFNTLL